MPTRPRLRINQTPDQSQFTHLEYRKHAVAVQTQLNSPPDPPTSRLFLGSGIGGVGRKGLEEVFDVGVLRGVECGEEFVGCAGVGFAADESADGEHRSGQEYGEGEREKRGDGLGRRSTDVLPQLINLPLRHNLPPQQQRVPLPRLSADHGRVHRCFLRFDLSSRDSVSGGMGDGGVVFRGGGGRHTHRG